MPLIYLLVFSYSLTHGMTVSEYRMQDMYACTIAKEKYTEDFEPQGFNTGSHFDTPDIQVKSFCVNTGIGPKDTPA